MRATCGRKTSATPRRARSSTAPWASCAGKQNPEFDALREHPRFQDADKARFYLAHEQRELGNYDEMLRTLQRIVDDFPKSAYRNESLLVIGDYHFDNSPMDTALLKEMSGVAAAAHAPFIAAASPAL